MHGAGKFSGPRLATRGLRKAVIPRCRHLRAVWIRPVWLHWGKHGFASGCGFHTQRDGIGQVVGKKIYSCILYRGRD